MHETLGRGFNVASEHKYLRKRNKKKWNTSTKGGDVALFHKSPKKKREHKRGKKKRRPTKDKAHGNTSNLNPKRNGQS